jgi:hypothetical protein
LSRLHTERKCEKKPLNMIDSVLFIRDCTTRRLSP